MSRENCQMCEWAGNDVYCGYYDSFFAKCEEVTKCPDGLDDDDDYHDNE